MRLILLAILLAGCAPTLRFPGPTRVVGRTPVPSLPLPEGVEPVTPPPPTAPPRHRPTSLGKRIADAADGYLKRSPPSRFRSDCSGFVCAVLDRVDISFVGGTQQLYDRAKELGALHHRKRPAPGDLAFFDNTWDRNKDGRLNDPLTHVGVVVRVDADSTVEVAHVSSSKGRTILRMNLLHPDVAVADHGEVYNDLLRRRTRSDPPRTKYLAGQLWRAFATLDPNDADAWSR